MRCGHVEPTIAHTWTVHFIGDPEPSRKPILQYVQCTNEATIHTPRDGCVFNNCAKHAPAAPAKEGK